MLTILDLFGSKEGMAGIVAYGVAASILSGPLAERHVALHLLNACKAGHVAELKKPRIKSFEDTVRDTTADSLEREGGPFGKMAADLLRLKSNLDKKQAAQNAALGAASCGCRLRQALHTSDVRWTWTVYVATWRLVGDAPGQTLATAATINPDHICVGGAS